MNRGFAGMLFATLIAGVGAGCGNLVTPVDELAIPCESNEECPSDYFCNESGTCIENSEGAPPEISFDGIRREGGGSYDKTLRIPANDSTRVQAKFTNSGSSTAQTVRVTFEGPGCTGFDFEYTSQGAGRTPSVPAGESFEKTRTVSTDADCVSSAQIDVQMATNTQQSSDSFQLELD